MFDWGKMRSIWGRIHSGRCLSIQVSFEELFLFLSCCRCGLLCCNELWVVYEAVLVLIVAVMKLPNKTGFPVKYWIRICSPVQYWVNHVLQLLISKNLCLRSRTSRLGVMIGLCARMRAKDNGSYQQEFTWMCLKEVAWFDSIWHGLSLDQWHFPQCKFLFWNKQRL